MKKLVYIAGPINASGVFDMYRNLRHFFEAERELLQLGFAPINPAADFTALMMMGDERVSSDLWTKMLMTKDEPLVKRSDALFLLPGWRRSLGAQKEVFWAEEACVPWFETYASLTAAFTGSRRA